MNHARLRVFLGILLSAMLCLAFSAQAEEKPCVSLYFFHNNPCESCHEINQLYAIADKTRAWDLAYLDFHEYREYTSAYNDALTQLLEWFDLAQAPHTPFLIVGNTILVGYDSIADGLNAAILESLQADDAVFSEISIAKYGSLKNSPAALQSTKTPVWPYFAAFAAVVLIFFIVRSHSAPRKMDP